MSEILLNAILHLFALICASRGGGAVASAREAVRGYLSRHVRIPDPQEYEALFEAFLDAAQAMDDDTRKATAWSVCTSLNEKLPRREQFVVVHNVLAILAASAEDAAPSADTLSEGTLGAVIAGGLDMTWDQYSALARLVLRPADHEQLDAQFLVLDDGSLPQGLSCRRLVRHGFKAGWTLLEVTETDSLFLVPTSGALTVSGRPAERGRVHQLTAGVILRDENRTPIYYSEIRAALDGGEAAPHVVFQGREVDFRFPGSDNGLHEFSFHETSGRLVGVMGGSGTGKSTLLSILNGTRSPDSGTLTINGRDLYAESDALDGAIGYVPQDDLLFDELTVFENLYYNAKLCMADQDEDALRQRVDAVLAELGQSEIRDFKVGSPLDKTISGGQRKRLNIALELIRGPAVLFADEPTSGLSSADSYTVVNLLKEQAARGRLVIVVIHQPSSDIFKLFDALWVLDKGGRPVFAGNPLDALAYFRDSVHAAGGPEVACPVCGNVNPEQLFDILESRELDERGHFTDQRRYPPQWWHERHLERTRSQPPPADAPKAQDPPGGIARPGVLGQMKVFFQRNALARLANRQYVLVNLLEAPLIAVLLGWLTRYAPGPEYAFGENRNIPLYFFMAVVVALFMGLSVSAEEIVRDRRILKRERFLNLSWFAYVGSKALFLAALVGVQTLAFTLIGTAMLDIPDMTLKTWAVLFSCGFCSAVLGLNVSAAFRSAVAIYILVPLLLIPQMLLAGSVISFDELISRDAGTNAVPWYGNVMPSRWGYEALLVEQYAGNRYMEPLFAADCATRQADYVLDYHIQELRGLGDAVLLQRGAEDWPELAARNLSILRTELPDLAADLGLELDARVQGLAPESYSRADNRAVRAFLDQAAQQVRERRTDAHERKRAIESLRRDTLGFERMEELERRHANKGVTRAVLNTLGLESFILSGDRIVQLAVPVCKPVEGDFALGHFAAGQKRFAGRPFPTFAFDLAVLWLLTGALFLALYLRLPDLVYNFRRR